MTLHRVLGGSLLLIFGCLCIAQQVEIKTAPIKYVDPSSGEKMYVAYCAACHGTDGKGHGAAARATKTPPTDLTTLAKHNGGQFPTREVNLAIRGDSAMPKAHGNKDMPVWGNTFLLSGRAASSEAEVMLRVNNLTTYVESLQQR